MKMDDTKSFQVSKDSKCIWRRGKMYGMLLESIQFFIKENYGNDNWNLILEHGGIKNMVFSTHKLYKDEIMLNLAKSCSVVLKDRSTEEYLNYFGQCFVKFFSHYGYDKILRVSGRYYRDFLNGIDNLHEMMRFSYPHLQSPSFLVESEDCEGCILSYRSKRKGFLHYVIGQLKECGKVLYDIDVDIITLYNNVTDYGCYVTFRLNFDNSPFVAKSNISTSSQKSNFSSLSSNTFLKVFPFCIIFDHNLIIQHTGCKLNILLSDDDLLGFRILDRFKLRRPLTDFTWDNVIKLQRVTFELQYLQPYSKRMTPPSIFNTRLVEISSGSKIRRPKFIFKGQMKYLKDWNMMAFLCTPLIGTLEDMVNVNLYLNDLNMYDNSRDMVMAGWQHFSQLEYSIEQQVEKSEKIAENFQKLDEWKQKSDDLLYSMIPESIANRLKNGEDPINTCEMFEEVTILFSYIVKFTDICAQASAFQIVECINEVFSSFDAVVDKYNCFKVETLGDAVYMVAGGVPDWRPDHAESVAGLALELLERSKLHKDPVTGNSLSIRVGLHTGSVVAGIVGKRMPQYCLFGDAVNTASRMQSHSEPQCIHISEPCNECLKGHGFVTVFRGTVNVKGKGEMKTYWLAGHEGDKDIEQKCAELQRKTRHKMKPKHSSFENGFDLHGMHSITSVANFALNFETNDEVSRIRRGSANQAMIKQNLSKVKFEVTPEEEISLDSGKSSDSDENKKSNKSSQIYNNDILVSDSSSPSPDTSLCNSIHNLTKSIDADFKSTHLEQIFDVKVSDKDLCNDGQMNQISVNNKKENIHTNQQSINTGEKIFNFSKQSSIKSLLFKTFNNNEHGVFHDSDIQCGNFSSNDVDQSLSDNYKYQMSILSKNDNSYKSSLSQSEICVRSIQSSHVKDKCQKSSSSDSDKWKGLTQHLPDNAKCESPNKSLSGGGVCQSSSLSFKDTGQRSSCINDDIISQALNRSLSEQHCQNGWLSDDNKKRPSCDQFLQQNYKLDGQTKLNGHKNLDENSDDDINDRAASVKLIHSEQRTTPESEMCDCCFSRIPLCFHRNKTSKENNVYIAIDTKSIPRTNSIHPTERSPCLLDIDM